jgi:hypothetical protein
MRTAPQRRAHFRQAFPAKTCFRAADGGSLRGRADPLAHDLALVFLDRRRVHPLLGPKFCRLTLSALPAPPAEMFADIRQFTELTYTPETNVFDTPSTTVS